MVRFGSIYVNFELLCKTKQQKIQKKTFSLSFATHVFIIVWSRSFFSKSLYFLVFFNTFFSSILRDEHVVFTHGEKQWKIHRWKTWQKQKKVYFFKKFHNWAWIQMPKNDNAFIFLDSCISRLSLVILLMFGINFRLFFLIKLTSSRPENIRYCISNFDRLVVNNYDSTDWYFDRKYEIICVWDAIACMRLKTEFLIENAN